MGGQLFEHIVDLCNAERADIVYRVLVDGIRQK
jgi:hypothetical protein